MANMEMVKPLLQDKCKELEETKELEEKEQKEKGKTEETASISIQKVSSDGKKNPLNININFNPTFNL